MNKKNVKSVLKEQALLLRPEKETFNKLRKEAKKFVGVLQKEVNRIKGNAEVFIGGSFAKRTLLKKYDYDVDVFVRFDWRYDNISDLLEKPLKNSCKKLNLKLERLHGSRDYFRAYIKGEGNYFEIIPVTKIKKPREERNVTDLSYFHVGYIKRKIKGFEDDLRLAKTFCHAQKVYGAESYIKGFSGYALECLIIYFKGFEKMLKELVKVKKGERLVIDIEKHFRRKNDVFFELNENKLHSPVIIVDPTYKERNALASLGWETFEKFQKSAKAFLRNPNKNYFIEKKLDVDKLKNSAKKKKAEFLHLNIVTDKQAGDIAGTKLKKFSEFLRDEVRKYFFISGEEFVYDGNKSADLYLTAKSKNEIIRIGPPLKMKSKKETRFMEKHIQAFRREHKNTYEKSGILHAKIKVNFTEKNFFNKWSNDKNNKKIMEDMGIVKLRVLD